MEYIRGRGGKRRQVDEEGECCGISLKNKKSVRMEKSGLNPG